MASAVSVRKPEPLLASSWDPWQAALGLGVWTWSWWSAMSLAVRGTANRGRVGAGCTAAQEEVRRRSSVLV
jgi:hypothetical protein